MYLKINLKHLIIVYYKTALRLRYQNPGLTIKQR